MRFTQVIKRLNHIGTLGGAESRLKKKQMLRTLIDDSQGRVLCLLDQRSKKELGVNHSSLQKAKSLKVKPLGDDLDLVIAQHQSLKDCVGPGSLSRKVRYLAQVLGICQEPWYMEAMEAYYTVGHTRIGVNQITLKQVVQDIRGVKGNNSNIALYDLYRGLKSKTMKPMLANAYGVLNPGIYALEPKYDGIRLVIETNPLRITSRNGLDFPSQFYKNIEAITQSLGTQSVTLDGQLWVPGSKPGEGFQILSKIIRARKKVQTPNIRYSVFDILSRQGQDLTARLYVHRRMVLEQWYQGLPACDIVDITQVYCHMRAEELTQVSLQEVYKTHGRSGFLQGLMIKDLHKPYQVGKRVTHWQKYKVENQSLDLLVIGAQKGTGRNQHRFASFDLGIIHESTISPIAQVGTGFTDQELDMLNQRYDTGQRTILQIRAQALTRSNLYPCGYSLRFPRYVRLRLDKDEPDDLDKAKGIFH